METPSLTAKKCYEFDCAGVIFYIVRLPLKGHEHDQHLIDYCNQCWGPINTWETWSTGVVCTKIYQEFWFKNPDAATTFLVAWG